LKIVPSNIDEARALVPTLLNDLETVTVKTEGILMKAKRLARLMRDEDAQQWLEYELSGYSKEHFDSRCLGTCEKYAKRSGRIDAEEKYYVASLPQLEAITEGHKARSDTLNQPMDQPAIVENYLVKRATEEFLANRASQQITVRQKYNENHALIVALRAAIHAYATDTYVAIEFGDVAQDIFEQARNDVDNFVRSYCPKAAEQIVAINERMRDKTNESRTAALTTCRRLLLTVADALFPARATDWVDSKGRPRKVGPEDYKNRLLAYLDEKQTSEGSKEVISSGIEHLAARLDAIYSKTSKGVHIDVTEQEARLAVIQTYLFLGEVAAHTHPTSAQLPFSTHKSQ
jgi:hypothetical protein